jgi:DNA-binding MarR family transcriptional regulator
MVNGKLEKKDYKMLANFRYHLRQYLHFSEQAAHAIGLTPQWYTALLYLIGFSDGDEVTIGALAERLSIKHHSAVGLVDRLVSHGLVERVSSEKDHRQVCVEITSRGKETLEQLAAVHQEELRRIGSQLRLLLREIGNTDG